MPVNCREKILSNDYYDVITDFPYQLLEDPAEDLCYADIDGIFNPFSSFGM